MPKFDFNVAMDVRAYGTVSIEGDTADEAAEKLTAEYVRDNFTPHGSGSDDLDYLHPSDVWYDGTAYNADTGESADVDAFSVPDGPWIKTDPVKEAAPELLAALERCVLRLSEKRTRKLDFDLELAIAEANRAIAKAEGGAA